MKGVILLAALAATSGCSTNVVRPVDPLPSRVVTFNDLDLHNSADVRELHDRIRRAAVKVCGGPIRPHDFAQEVPQFARGLNEVGLRQPGA